MAGRNTQGVRLIRLDTGDKITAIAVVPSEDEKEEVVAAKEPTPAVPAKAEKEDGQGSLFEKGEPEKPSAKKEGGAKASKSAPVKKAGKVKRKR